MTSYMTQVEQKLMDCTCRAKYYKLMLTKMVLHLSLLDRSRSYPLSLLCPWQ